MFDAIQNPPSRHVRNFVLHSLIACFIVPLAGFLEYRATPFAGIAIGICATRLLRDRAAIFAVIPTFLLFSLGAMDVIVHWDASWSHVTRWQDFRNKMFGPHCGGSECLYTVFTALFMGGIGYSVGAYLVLWKNVFPKDPKE